MSEGHLDGRVFHAARHDRSAVAQGAARWLHLAAAPTFAVMAVVTGVQDRGASDVLCAVTGALPLNGMMAMYALMSLFHAAPWIRLIDGRPAGSPSS
jgi:hypothetical protein